MTPPRVALFLLWLLVPRDSFEVIGGDLEEEWNASSRPSRRQFWRLTLRSIMACAIDRAPHRPRTGDRFMKSVLDDVRYALRLMRRRPGFTLAAVSTLALGIGANSAIFSIIHVLSFKPLPYRDPGRVAFVQGWDIAKGESRFSLPQSDMLDLQRHTRALEAISAYRYLSANLTGGDTPERVQAYRVTSNTFDLLGVAPELGRTFGPSDIGEGRLGLAVISHGLWQRVFGGSASVIGRSIIINGDTHEVVGVMPRRFEFPVFNFKGDLWIPWVMDQGERGQAEARHSATVLARVRADVSYDQAQAELDAAMQQLALAHPETNRDLGARLKEMATLGRDTIRPLLAIVFVTVGLVLVLACANVANLLLARGVSRYREFAVRAAIGASRARIYRQILIESLVLALAGGASAVLLGTVTLRALHASLPEAMLATVPNVNDIGMDLTTVAYTSVVAVLVSVAAGLLPAWRVSRASSGAAVHSGLKDSASAGGGRTTRRLRTGLVIAEVALATWLLVGAGLLVRSYSRLQHVDPGFAPAQVATMTMTLPEGRYPDPARRELFYARVLERVTKQPGVTAAGFVNVLPFSTYDRGTQITIDGHPPMEPGREPEVSYRVSSPQYHATLGIPLLAGRFLADTDTEAGARVALVNEELVRQLFGQESALSKRVKLGSDSDSPWMTIVGVVGNVRHSTLTTAADPELYVPLAQAPPSMMMLAAKGDAPDLTEQMRASVRAVDPLQPVYHVKTLQALVDDSTLVSRASASTMALFGVLALVLANVGVYGVVAYGVSQQTKEFGVRAALGATPRDLMRLVIGGGLAMVGTGIAVGLAGALAVSQLLEATLVGVGPADPLTYAMTFCVLAASGLLACAVPAWRASATQPVIALRTE